MWLKEEGGEKGIEGKGVDIEGRVGERKGGGRGDERI